MLKGKIPTCLLKTGQSPKGSRKNISKNTTITSTTTTNNDHNNNNNHHQKKKLYIQYIQYFLIVTKCYTKIKYNKTILLIRYS